MQFIKMAFISIFAGSYLVAMEPEPGQNVIVLPAQFINENIESAQEADTTKLERTELSSLKMQLVHQIAQEITCMLLKKEARIFTTPNFAIAKLVSLREKASITNQLNSILSALDSKSYGFDGYIAEQIILTTAIYILFSNTNAKNKIKYLDEILEVRFHQRSFLGKDNLEFLTLIKDQILPEQNIIGVNSKICCDLKLADIQFNSTQQIPLFCLAAIISNDVVNILLALNANINAKDRIDNSAFHFCCIVNKCNIVANLIRNKTLRFNNNIAGASALSAILDNGCFSCLTNVLNITHLFNDLAIIERVIKNLICCKSKPESLKLLVNRIMQARTFKEINPILKLYLFIASHQNSFFMLPGSPFYKILMENIDHCELLMKVPTPNGNGATIDYNLSPLHVACNFENIDAINFLIKNGANLELLRGMNMPSLAMVASSDYLDVFKLLLSKGAKSDITIQQMPLLFLAIASKAKRVFRYLLETKIQASDIVNAALPFIIRLTSIVPFDCQEFIQLLIENGAEVNHQNNGDLPIHFATKTGNLEIIKLLASNRADLRLANWVGHTILHIAARDGHSKIVEFALDNGIGIDVQDIDQHTALHLAIKNQRIDTAKLLLSKNPNLELKDSTDRTAAEIAILSENLEIIKLFIPFISYLKNNPGNILRYALISNQFEVIEFLLSNGIIDPEEPNPLCFAIRSHPDEKLGLFLLEKFPELVNFAGKRGHPLKEVCFLTDKTKIKYIVELLIKNEASFELLEDADEDLLITCIQLGNIDALEAFLDNGADINFRNKAGLTPLHVALILGNQEIIKLLLQKGANPTIPNNIRHKRSSRCVTKPR